MQGDANTLIKMIPDRSVDLIVTDPPYQLSKNSNTDHKDKLSKSINALTNELDNLELCNGYNYNILDEYLRIMKKINIYIWCNKKQIPLYLDFFVKKHHCVFDILVWIKTNPIPLYGNQYLNDKEYCLYFRKGVKLHTTYESGKTYFMTPINTKDKKAYGHPTVKPLPIIEKLILNSSRPGDTVADFFLGSGTTSVASIRHGRNFIGAEKNEVFYKVAVERAKCEGNLEVHH